MITLIKQLYFTILFKRYIKVGTELGDAMSYSFMGQIHGFEGLVKNFKNLEKKISQLGYIPLDLQLFIQAGGYGVKLPKLNKGDQQTINLALQENNEIIQASLSMQNSNNSIINLMQD